MRKSSIPGHRLHTTPVSTLPLWTIDVGGLSVEDLGCFHRGLRKRWVRMDGHANVRRQRAHFDGEDALGDQFARAHAHDADSEHALCFRIDEQLSESF